jgi:hypothetical protein
MGFLKDDKVSGMHDKVSARAIMWTYIVSTTLCSFADVQFNGYAISI